MYSVERIGLLGLFDASHEVASVMRYHAALCSLLSVSSFGAPCSREGEGEGRGGE